MDQAAVVVSESKAKSTIRKKLKRPTIKVNLCNPHRITWPQVGELDVKFVLDKLESVFKSVQLRKPIDIMKHEKPNEYKEFTRLRSVARRAFIEKLNRNHPGNNFRSQLVCGLQTVSKSLERDALCLVVVDRDCWDMTKHLSQLAAVRQCPGLAVPGLSTRIAPLLGLNTLSTLGVRKSAPQECEDFASLVEEISAKCPAVSLPWSGLEDELQQDVVPEHSSSSSSESEISSPGLEATQSEVPDFRHLYISRAELPNRPLLEFQDNNTERVFVKREGMECSDFIAFDQSSSQCVEGTSKRKKDQTDGGKNKATGYKKQRTISSWQAPVFGKIQGNQNRVSNKKQ